MFRKSGLLLILLWAGTLLWLSGPLLAAEKAFYLGNWSSGRGDPLIINKTTLKFAGEKIATYRDRSRPDDKSISVLQIINPRSFFLHEPFILCEQLINSDKSTMKLTGFRSYQDLLRRKNPQSEVTWYKD